MNQVGDLTRGFIPRKIQQTNKKTEISINQAGARGHKVDLHAYISVKSGSFCASSVRWNRQLTNAMMIQLVKKEALVIEISQFKTVSPPAKVYQQMLDFPGQRLTGVLPAIWIYPRTTATKEVMIKASLGRPLSSTAASLSHISFWCAMVLKILEER